jgi:hypothetical protein
MAEPYTLEVQLSREEIDALDQACGLWESDGKVERSWVIRNCLRYGLLSLRAEGLITLDEAALPEFVHWYDGVEAAYLEANISTTDATTPE